MPAPTRDLRPGSAELLLDRIDRRLSDMGRSRYWLDSEVTGGKTTKVVKEIERKRTIPKEPRLRRIAELLGVSLDYLMGRTDEPDPVRSEVSLGEKVTPWRGRQPEGPGIPLMGTGDCADIELHDENGELVNVERSSFDDDYPVRMIARPPALLGARDLYAIYFHGESMIPRFEPGEVGIVDPARPVRPGDYVLVQINNGEEDAVMTVLVKRLVHQNSKRVILEQFNPALRFTVPRIRIARLHRILPQTDLLFG